MSQLLRPGGSPGAPEDTRNMIVAMVLSMAIIFGYDFFIGNPQRERQIAAQQAAVAAAKLNPQAAEAATPISRSQALTASPRVAIDTPSVDGSINLIGARFDDLSLKNFRQKVAKDSPEVMLLNPQGSAGAYDAYLGWENPISGDDVVGARTQWTAAEGARLTPQTPVTLTYSAPNGLVFTRTITVDQSFMFTIDDEVRNSGPGEAAIRPFSVVRRADLPLDFVNSSIVHQGMSGVLGAKQLLEEDSYDKAKKFAQEKAQGKRQAESVLFQTEGPGGWLGISDHYWLTALVPAQNEAIKATFDATPRANYIDYRADYVGSARALAPGQSIKYTQRLFSGAKRVDLLKGYQADLNIPDFDKAVDWGNFWFLTRPYFWLLDHLGKWAGSFGIAILMMTVIVRLALFPLVSQSAAAMAKMRKLQPQMKELQERFAADKQRQQQEIMALYQREKVNPLAGCFPLLLQIPLLYALYKVLTVTIEMRHAPFFGWIQDLSARDPTSILNLFGLLPYDPTHWPLIGVALGIGVWPLLYGVTMALLQSLSPPAPDPTQQMMMKLLPILFTFMFASFAAGLVIYWTWSNVLGIAQQYIIMRRHGVETEFDKFLAKRFGKKAESGAT
jgi:YidC/Oxa1 family membrane protein insertase